MQIIIHRVNTIEKLREIPKRFGVEIDVRGYGSKLLLSHDPIDEKQNYTDLEDFLKEYEHKTLVFNMKEAGYEERVLRLAEWHGIKDFFLLDVEFPYLYKATRNNMNRKIAVRFSEAEPIEYVERQMHEDRPLLNWVWIDTNTQLPVTRHNKNVLETFKTCLVCPERWGRPEDIPKYKEELVKIGFRVDAVMTSMKYAGEWELF